MTMATTPEIIGNAVNGIAALLAKIDDKINHITHNGLDIVGTVSTNFLDGARKDLVGALNCVSKAVPILGGVTKAATTVTNDANTIGNDVVQAGASAAQKVVETGTNLVTNIANDVAKTVSS